MLIEDHRRRVVRLLRGERPVSDMERLFSDLRMMKPGRASVREVGHFAAHREERDSGISLERANDIQTSARLWQKQFDGVPPDANHLKEAGRANLNIMPDDRIRETLGISRQTAEQTFAKRPAARSRRRASCSAQSATTGSIRKRSVTTFASTRMIFSMVIKNAWPTTS